MKSLAHAGARGMPRPIIHKQDVSARLFQDNLESGRTYLMRSHGIYAVIPIDFAPAPAYHPGVAANEDTAGMRAKAAMWFFEN